MPEKLLGPNSILEALRAGRRNLEKIYIRKGRQGPKIAEIISLAKIKGIIIKLAERDELNRVSGTPFHQGIMAIAAGVPYLEPEEILALAKVKQSPFFLVLDGIKDPQNLGSIIRTAEAAGVDGIILPKHRAVGLTSTVAKVACGALEHVKVCRVTNIPGFLDRMKKEGIWVVGADVQASSNIYEVDLIGSLALVIGAEDTGLKPLVKKKCDVIASIPMEGSISSLNAAVAGAIIMYEVVRQRKAKKF